MKIPVSPPMERRRTRPTHQVKFWTDPGVYTEFVAVVRKNNLYVQDVLRELMISFTTTYKEPHPPTRHENQGDDNHETILL